MIACSFFINLACAADAAGPPRARRRGRAPATRSPGARPRRPNGIVKKEVEGWGGVVGQEWMVVGQEWMDGGGREGGRV